METIVRLLTFIMVVAVYLTVGLFANAMFLLRYVIPAPFSSAIRILSGARSENTSFLADAISRWSDLMRGAFHILSGDHDDVDAAQSSFSLITNIISILFFLSGIIYWILFYEISSVWEIITFKNAILYGFVVLLFGFHRILFIPIIIYHWSVALILICFFVLPWMLVGSLGKILLQALVSAFGLAKSPNSHEVTRAAALPNRAINYLLMSFNFKENRLGEASSINVSNGFKKIVLSILMWFAVGGFYVLWEKGIIHQYRGNILNIAAKYGIVTASQPQQQAQNTTIIPKTSYRVRVVTVQVTPVRERPSKDSIVRQTLPVNKFLFVFQQSSDWIEVGEKSPMGWVNLISVKSVD